MLNLISMPALDSLYLSSLHACREKSRISQGNSEMPMSQQEMLFNTLSDGFKGMMLSDISLCLESLKALNNFASQYEIVISQNVGAVITNIMELLNSEYKDIVSNALIFVSNCFAQNKPDITDFLIRNNSIEIIHDLFLKWETDLFIEILYTLSNVCSISQQCRDLLLAHFSGNDFLLLLSSTLTHESLLNRCKSLLKKLVIYQLSPENAFRIFSLLCQLKQYAGSWIFEDLGYCAKWLKGSISIPNELLVDAFQSLLEPDNESIIGSLIFIGFAASEINETVIELLTSSSDEISSFALWAVIQFIRSKKIEAVQLLLSFNIIDILKQAFVDGSYRKKTESGICVTDMIRFGSTPEAELILSSGIYFELIEMLNTQDNHEFAKAFIESILILLSRDSNERILRYISEIVRNTDIIEIIQNLELSGNEYLGSISRSFLGILENFLEYTK